MLWALVVLYRDVLHHRVWDTATRAYIVESTATTGLLDTRTKQNNRAVSWRLLTTATKPCGYHDNRPCHVVIVDPSCDVSCRGIHHRLVLLLSLLGFCPPLSWNPPPSSIIVVTLTFLSPLDSGIRCYPFQESHDASPS